VTEALLSNTHENHKHFLGNKEVAPPVVKEPIVKIVKKKGEWLVVDGITLDTTAQPFQCRLCGAIWQKLRFATATTATADPRCAICNHDLKHLKEVDVTL
jgi:hypothetical protein